MVSNKLSTFVFALAAFSAAPASAAVVTLDFTGIATTSNSTGIGGFYNGGVSDDGTTGVNYGVLFSSNALAINTYNGANEPNPGVLYFLNGSTVSLNYAAGFSTGFSFFYASNSATTINVYSELNATGTLLGSVVLAANAVNSYDVWTSTGVSFAGIAKSVDFGGSADHVGYDQITFGSAVAPGSAVPEPATWAMMLAGFGMIGFAARRRSAVTTAVTYA